MKIETIKDLEAVLKLCRKQGVTSVQIDGIYLRLGDLPDSKTPETPKEDVKTEDTYTEEELMFWSSQPQVG